QATAHHDAKSEDDQKPWRRRERLDRDLTVRRTRPALTYPSADTPHDRTPRPSANQRQPVAAVSHNEPPLHPTDFASRSPNGLTQEPGVQGGRRCRVKGACPVAVAARRSNSRPDGVGHAGDTRSDGRQTCQRTDQLVPQDAVARAMSSPSNGTTE